MANRAFTEILAAIRTRSGYWAAAATGPLYLALTLVATAAFGADWPMWGYDAARSGAAPAALELPETLHLQWVRELSPPRRAWPKQMDDGDKLEFDLSYSPIVLDGRLFVASMTADRLTAYAADTGEELWRFYADGPVRVAPAAWEGMVYFVSDDGRLYCLDAATGTLRWKFDAAPSDHRVLGNERVTSMWPARGGPVVDDGTVYFASGIWPFLGTFVYALDARTGEVRWANTGHATEWQAQPHGGAYAFAGLAPQGYLALADDRLVAAGGRSLPGLFERRDGTLLHSQVAAKPAGGYRVQVEGEHYFNHGRRFRLSDGKEAGSGRIENEAAAALRARTASVKDELDSPAFESIAAAGRLYVTTHAGRLYCFGGDAVETPRVFADGLRSAWVNPAAETAGTTHPTPTTDGTRRVPATLEAADILAITGVTDGYALVLGAGDGELLEQLAVRSSLHLVALEPDAEKAAAVRRRLDDAGLYGTRVAVIPARFDEAHYPPYISSLVVALDPEAAGLSADAESLERLVERLRPYGGRAYLRFAPDAFAWDALPACEAAVEDGVVLLTRPGPLPGAGQWTHQYGDSANTVYSDDDRVRLPLGPLWFGGPSNDNILPRHGHGPIPQVAAGRVILPGVDTLSARCVYTGRELWVREFPGLGHPFTVLGLEERYRRGESVFLHSEDGLGAHYIGSPYVSLPDAIYVRYKTRVYRLDPATGEMAAEFDLPVAKDEPGAPDWGHISVWGDLLLTTTDPHIFRDGDPNARFASLADIKGREWSATSSGTLAVLDRHTGKLLWRRQAEVGFRHNAVATAGGTVFVIDGLSERAIELMQRRGAAPGKPAVVALDARTGKEKWRTTSDVFGTWLGYCEEFDVLVEAGRRGGLRDLPDEPGNRLRAYQGRDGSVLWDRATAYTGPVAIHGDTLLTAVYWHHSGNPYGMSSQQEGRRLQLLTGEDVLRQHPLTGEAVPWTYWRAYGCNTANVSKHLITFRSGAAGFADLEHDGGTGTFGGFRAGCTANMVAADGVLLAPDYTRTCTCSYQNQTSLGLVHMPELELWTANRVEPAARSAARVGINLGAPGSRRAEDGALWIDYPRSTAPAPEADVQIEPENVAWYRKHSLLVDAAEGHAWVAASGGEGIESVRIGNLEHGRYRVRLHFAEPRLDRPGQRVFDVLLQAAPVLERFDPVAAAGGPDRGVVRQFDVHADGALTVALRAAANSSAPPVLSGIELRAIDPAVATLPVPSISRTSATLEGAIARAGHAKSVEVFFRWRASGDADWQTTPVQTPVAQRAEGDRPVFATRDPSPRGTPSEAAKTGTVPREGTFSETLDGLSAETPYEFQAAARVDGQEAAGPIRSFTPGDTFALTFDNHHVHVPHHAALNPAGGSYTFEAWAKFDSANDAGDEWDLVLAKRRPNGYYVGMRRGHGWNFMLRDDEGKRTDTQAHRSIAEIYDRWLFVQAVVDRQNNRQILRVFDPQEGAWHEAAVAPPGNIGTGNDLYFGKDVDAGRFQVGGALGPIRFWRKARTRQDAEADMHARLPADAPGLAGYWPLRDGYGGARLLDHSPSANHGRIFGAEWTTTRRPLRE